MAEQMRVAVIGLGAMGLQMARHLVDKGFAVTGYDIDPAAMARAREHRVETAGTIAEAGAAAEVVVVMVQNDRQVEDVIRNSGLLDRLAAGAVIAIASSVSPETCRRVAALAAPKGVGVIDTPVVLGQEAANNGTLTIYAGGEAEWVERARPALAAFGRRIFHVGPLGTGQVAKTINNLLLWSCMSANMEALGLAKALGADVPRLVEALLEGSGANWSLSRWGKSTGKWAVKDMEVALAMAADAQAPVPLARLVQQLVTGINQDKMKALLS
jgi:3-hydroxyisobutyrate dehydrogenase-like beta-hydroxyacid dehydrogenase